MTVTYGQYKEYCLNLAANCHFEATEIHCVCSTPTCEVLGTTKAAKAFKWAKQYPKLSSDCKRAWRAVVSLHYHAKKGVASGLKFVEAHPLKSVEEFIQFSIVYSGRTRLNQSQSSSRSRIQKKSELLLREYLSSFSKLLCISTAICAT
jgi:hypothetical protein